jgi:hypothetical protein
MTTKSLFISHISEEADVAVLLKKMIQDDFLGLVGCFTSSDIGSIGAGENWLTSIERAMSEAKAVIVLCSKASVHRPWVQFEVGAAWMKGVPIIPACHSGMKVDELQMPLSLRQGLELGSEQGLAKLYDGVARALKIDRTPRIAELPERLSRLKQIEDRFRLSQIQQFELFMDIILPPPGYLESETVPDDTPVELGESSLQLFGLLSGTGLTWRKIVKAAEKTPDTRWLRQLQRCIYLASNNERFRPVQAVYHTEGGSYQPQLSKREVHANGTARFHVHFVDTVVAPLTEVENEFGLLATLLRLGLRFRYEVIERFRKLERPVHAMGASNSSEATLKQLRDAIEVIENDALSRGAEKMDRDAVMALFERKDDHDTMADVQDSWDEARALLFRGDPPLSNPEVIDVLKQMRRLNFHFMRIGTRRFHEMIGKRWDSGDAAKAKTPQTQRAGRARRQRIASPAPAP